MVVHVGSQRLGHARLRALVSGDVTRALPLLVVAVAACAGREGEAQSPDRMPPRLQVVRCAPATPTPVLFDDGVTFGGLTKAEARELDRPRRRGAQVALLAGSTTAGVSGEEVARVLRGRLDELRACYAREATKSFRAGGNLRLVFTVTTQGRAADVSISGTSTPFESCVGQALAGAQFPRPKLGILRVGYELDLAPPQATVAAPWTPFAIDALPPPAAAPAMARAAAGALRGRLDRFGACFHGFAPTGSVRAMLDLDDSGTLRAARVGGLGDRETERCLGRALAGLVVPSPMLQTAEVACDLSRGDARRWRIDPHDYDVIRATRSGVAHGGQTLAPTVTDPEPLPGNRTYLVVVDADTPGTVLELALAWAFEGDTTIVAAADPAGGPPAVIGAGRSTYALGDTHDATDAQEISLELYGDAISACLGGDTDTVPVAEAGRLAQRLAAACRKRPCVGTVALAVDGGAPASLLPGVIDGLRRAGFERVLIGSGLGCARTQGRPARG